MKPTLILTGGDKGGTGKTTIARAMMDHLARRNVLTRAFDTEHLRGTLHRFYPGNTEILDLTNVAMQMKILDTMETANHCSILCRPGPRSISFSRSVNTNA
jgi:adenylylsulfate kinase-like enzyme